MKNKLVTLALLAVSSGLAETPPKCTSEGRISGSPGIVSRVEPEYSEEAVNAQIAGTVILEAVVDSDGQAHDFCVARSLGFGLDENAVEAVKKWTFRPTRPNGRSAPVTVVVEVNFRCCDGKVKARPSILKTTLSQRCGDLLIQLARLSITTEPPGNTVDKGHHYVNIAARIRNMSDKSAISIANLYPTLKAEYALEYLPFGSRDITIRELLPGEETERSVTFVVKNDVRPVEFDLAVHGGQCGSDGSEPPMFRFRLETEDPAAPTGAIEAK
jgi:TonB family protein